MLIVFLKQDILFNPYLKNILFLIVPCSIVYLCSDSRDQ